MLRGPDWKRNSVPTTPDGFERRIARLKGEMTAQAQRAQGLIERAVEAAFERSAEKALAVVGADAEIDRADIAIEKEAVALLADATREGAALTPQQLRLVLTIVKMNNEVERIADGAVSIAEQVPAFVAMGAGPPATFRVMANSVIGICEGVSRAFEKMDADQARVALRSDDAALAFKKLLLRESQERIASGALGVDAGFALHAMASDLERIADHACNIAEQVIYAATGAVTRQEGGRWTAPTPAG